MSIRLAFCGKMKSGKDTAVNHLKSLHDGTVIHMFAAGYRFVEWLMLYPVFGCAIDPDNKTKFERLMLQWIGHWGRVFFGKDIWLKKTLKMIKKTKGNVYITGVRYPNEVKRLKEIDIESVWVERPEADRLKAGAFNISHETETALDTFTAFDYKIPNDKDLKTFLRRVESYGHIGKALELINETTRSGPQTTFMDGAGSRGFQTLDDGSIKGWQPSETDNVDPTEANKEIAAKLKPLSGDLLKKLAIGVDAELIERRLSSITFYNKYDSTASEIAQEIRRFADVVDHDLKVANGTEAINTVRKNLHGILDNRGIPGENRATVEPYTAAEPVRRPDQPVTTFMDGPVDVAYGQATVAEGNDKDTTLLEIRRLAKKLGVSQVLVVNEGDEEKVRIALSAAKRDASLNAAAAEVSAKFDESERFVGYPAPREFVAEPSYVSPGQEAFMAEVARKAKVERAKRDRYNEARKARRAAARAAKKLNSFGRAVKRGSKLQAVPLKKAAKGRRK